jgi:hypothetical protein
LRAFFGWAVDKDHVTGTPFKKGGTAVKGLFAHEGDARDDWNLARRNDSSTQPIPIFKRF